MEEMDDFLSQLESGLITMQDKVKRLNELLILLDKQGALEKMQDVYINKGKVKLPVHLN